MVVDVDVGAVVVGCRRQSACLEFCNHKHDCYKKSPAAAVVAGSYFHDFVEGLEQPYCPCSEEQPVQV